VAAFTRRDQAHALARIDATRGHLASARLANAAEDTSTARARCGQRDLAMLTKHDALAIDVP
jgi:hypothetical protein